MSLHPTTPPLDPTAAWHQVAADLRAHAHDHPGQWWLLDRVFVSPHTAKCTARDIRNGRIVAFRPAGHYDASSHGDRVKARYLGPTRRAA